MWIFYSGVNLYINRLVIAANDILSNPDYHKSLVTFLTDHDEQLNSQSFLPNSKNYGTQVYLKSVWRPFVKFRFQWSAGENCILINRCQLRRSQQQDLSSLLENSYLMAQHANSKNMNTPILEEYAMSEIGKFFAEIGISMS